MRVQKVSKEGYEDFIFNTRSQGYYDMLIHSEAERETYYLTEYVVPFENNEHMSGYDFASDNIAVEYFEKAGISNKKQITSIYNVRPDTTGFLFISPLYQSFMPIDTEQERKDNFTGVLIIEINPQIFFENALGTGVASDSTVVFDIYDELNKNKSVIFSSFNKEILNQQYKPEISEILEIEIYGHKILLDFKTIPDFGGEFQKYLL